MSTANDFERINKINSPKYIKFKVILSYSLSFAIFFCFGFLTNNFIESSIPQVFANHLNSFFSNKFPDEFKIIDFIATIIYNSVDIFKISFIIIIAGFTYISGTIAKLVAVAWGFYNGLAIGYYTNTTTHKSIKCLMLMFMLLHFAVFINNCVCAELTSQKFSKYRNANVLLTSKYFWQYIGQFLISFGYTLMICTAYSLALRLLT